MALARIHFGSVQIGSISDSSAVHSGENHLIGWKQASKKNEGFGKLGGRKNQYANSSHVVCDKDVLDEIGPEMNEKP
ncbi:hypothetical protein BXP28_19715 [Paenibacillus larvae subsp. larvae]|nr:hypothetical protein BXP28_19715 [Paenibacillus larvae subsp. larvae]